MCHCHKRQRVEQYHDAVRRRHSIHRVHTRACSLRTHHDSARCRLKLKVWTLTPTMVGGTTSHSTVTMQPATSQVTVPCTQGREWHSREALQPLDINMNKTPPTIAIDPLAQYQHTGCGQTTHITDAAQLRTHRRRDDDLREILYAGCLPQQKSTIG